jgi:hypothetical protein
MRENQTYNPTLPELSEETKQWLAIRKEAGLKIDPETCEIFRCWAYDVDPYGVMDSAEIAAAEGPTGGSCIRREYFVRNHGSDIWVWAGDLPAATTNALWEKRKGGPLT